jgi:hypothetical protein
MLTTIELYLKLLSFINRLEKIVSLSILKKIKIACIKHLICQKKYIDNDITNIVCTKPNKLHMCEKAIKKIVEKKNDVFRISPRAIVVCVLNNNRQMLNCIKQLGYPLEMIIYASNYNLIKKRRLEKYIDNF